MDDGYPGGFLAQKYATGFAWLEWRAGRVHARQGFSIDSRSIFWLGCLSKPITATAVMLLVDRGELSLDDPIGRFVPEAGAALGAVPLRRLLSHSAGLPRNVPGWSSFFDPEWLAESIDDVAPRLVLTPDDSFGHRSYSSAGFVVLGLIVQRVASTEFGEFVARELFGPLGMENSFCINAIPPAQAAHIAPVLMRTPDGITPWRSTHAAIRNSMPFAGFFSTVDDLATFMRVFVERDAASRLMREATVSHMFCEEARGQGVHQGLGWPLCFRDDPSQSGDPGVCGCWHTSSNGSLVAGDRTRGTAIVIAGQGVAERDLIPLRAAQWRYLERALHVSPTPDRADAVSG